ncbi:MAG: response regulator [Oscillochloris sp.]|nr:response regulator [Oscillochloris sp.]
MEEPLRVLHIEDSDDDALLVLRALKRGGFNVSVTRIETAEGLSSALARRSWDVIIADYQLPHFGAQEALRIVQQHGADLPFIVVSGTIGEQHAVELMRTGAHDYVMKDRLERLSEAIRREIREAGGRRERRRIEAALQALIAGTAGVTGADFLPRWCNILRRPLLSI